MSAKYFGLIFFILSGFYGKAQQPNGSKDKHPNIIIIYADDLGYGDVASYGGKSIYTPNIDKLADHGLRFTNGHSTASTCTPSRYSILTGRYAWRKKGTGIASGDAPLIIDSNRTTIADIFKRAGYKTAAIGKWHLGLGGASGPDWNGDLRPGPIELGFDYSFLIPATPDRVPCVYVENHHVVNLDPKDPITVSYEHPVGDLPTGEKDPRLLKMKTSPGQGHLGIIINGISRIGWMSGGRSAWWNDSIISDVMIGKAIGFIKSNKNQPFFLYFASHDVHVPRVPDHRFKGKSGMGPRGDEILELDWEVGELLKTLEEEHLSKNTLIIFTSDNGPVLDDGYQDGAVAGAAHPMPPELPSMDNPYQKITVFPPHKPAGPFNGGKYSIFDGGTRIPFITYWPGVIKPGVSEALVCQIDFLSSFASLTGQKLKKEDGPDSFNLLNTFFGKSKQGRKQLVEEGQTLALLKADGWKYIQPHDGPALLKLVNINSGLSMEPQVYNFNNDISETDNVAAQHPEMVKKMAAELKQIQNEGRSR